MIKLLLRVFVIFFAKEEEADDDDDDDDDDGTVVDFVEAKIDEILFVIKVVLLTSFSF